MALIFFAWSVSWKRWQSKSVAGRSRKEEGKRWLIKIVLCHVKEWVEAKKIYSF